MKEEEIKRQLKLSKQQNKNERYDYLCSQFNCVNYVIKLEKYTNKLQQENKKYKEVIDKLKNKTKENIENAKYEITTLTIGDKAYYQYIEKILDNYVDILNEVIINE